MAELKSKRDRVSQGPRSERAWRGDSQAADAAGLEIVTFSKLRGVNAMIEYDD